MPSIFFVALCLFSPIASTKRVSENAVASTLMQEALDSHGAVFNSKQDAAKTKVSFLDRIFRKKSQRTAEKIAYQEDAGTEYRCCCFNGNEIGMPDWVKNGVCLQEGVGAQTIFAGMWAVMKVQVSAGATDCSQGMALYSVNPKFGRCLSNQQRGQTSVNFTEDEDLGVNLANTDTEFAHANPTLRQRQWARAKPWGNHTYSCNAPIGMHNENCDCSWGGAGRGEPTERHQDEEIKYSVPCTTALTYLFPDTNLYSWAFPDGAIQNLAVRCPELKEIDLHLNPQLTDVAVEALAEKCSELKRINLENTQVTDGGLDKIAKNCEELQEISLSDTEVTRKGVKNLLWNCHNLRSLTTPLGPSDLKQLQCEYPNVEITARLRNLTE